MTEKLIPPAEVDALVQKVWDEAQQKIKESVEYTIRSELSLRAQTVTRKRMDALLEPLIKTVIEERMGAISDLLNKRAEQIVEKAIDRFDQSFSLTLKQALSASVQDPMHTLGNKLSDLMWRAVEEVVNIRSEELRQKRVEEQYQARLKREEKAKEGTQP
jgi:hypothetical protein